MATTTLLCYPKPIFEQNHSTPTLHKPKIPQKTRHLTRKVSSRRLIWNQETVVGLVGSGLVLALVDPALASELRPLLLGSSLQLSEPANALSLPTWAIHVSSVVEWITAMALVWQYGEKSGFESWKGLSWGMIKMVEDLRCPLLLLRNPSTRSVYPLWRMASCTSTRWSILCMHMAFLLQF
ncbi:Uncharacterized protein TCM_046744 isoform 2 [Theobroma cacao]|uniref:Uncharacterized protein isoform 2 n=1 Tax=Theobroma cacao TaxID=3641 RepID=A0A061G4M6_THECC|nr:Uncharacterized protein TCM_046744 isoform 2 [Theobroma cacao]